MRIITILVVSSVFTATLASTGLAAQSAPPAAGATTAAPAEGWFAVVKGDNTNVRTAASVEGGYPFFKVNEGDLVHVLYERFGWSRIRTDTPIFGKAFGYVVADSIDADGTVGTLTRRAMFSAPNLMQANRPAVSWEGLDPALPAGTKLTLIERIPASTAGDPAKWKVGMPATQEAWVNSAWLRKATQEEIAKAMPKPEPEPEVVVAEGDATSEGTTETPATDGGARAEAKDAAEDTGASETTTVAETSGNESDDAVTAEEARTARLAALDKAFRTMLKERIESAELEMLQQQFLQFSKDPGLSDVERATVLSRAEVLAIKVEVQDNLARLSQMRERSRIDADNIDATRVAMDARAPYDMMGMLNASVVFSGEGTMPLLFRLQDRSGGQTIAYIRPDDRFDIAAMTGLYVGILGSMSYDETLQLNVISPRRIDLQGARLETPATPVTPPAPEAETVAEGEAGNGD